MPLRKDPNDDLSFREQCMCSKDGEDKVCVQVGGILVTVSSTLRTASSTAQQASSSSQGEASSTESSVPASPPAYPTDAEPAEDTEPSWTERRIYAKSCGENAARRLKDQRPVYPIQGRTTDKKAKCYVVLRDNTGTELSPVLLATRYADIASRVIDTEASAAERRKVLHDKAVFQAWPSKTEAEAYVEGAGKTLPS